MANNTAKAASLTKDDMARLRELRAQRPAHHVHRHATSRGALIADWVAETVGSWRFIIIQSAILTVWIALNIVGYIARSSFSISFCHSRPPMPRPSS